jgi:hypothetical protein
MLVRKAIMSGVRIISCSDFFLLAGLFVALTLDHAAAQQPTSEQRDAIRAACRSDFMANCSGVQPGGKDALGCLVRNSGKLAPACRTAVDAIAAKPAAPAAAAPAPAPAAGESSPPPSSSPPSPLTKTKQPAAAPQAAPAAVAAAPQKATPQQQSAIRAACRSDFMARCAGVQPRGAAALQCLQRNSAQLSPSCQSAVAAIGGSAAPVPSAPPAAAAPAVAPLGPMPMMRPREALAILRICDADQRTLCGNVPFGDGRVISCLAANAQSLSPSCYAALSAAAQR